MKANPTPENTPLHQNINNIRFSSRPGGTANAATATNNYNSKSQAYQRMNQMIVAIDNQFKQLTPTQQAVWNSQAPAFADIQLCGCDENITTGQKLYRSVQYIRNATGQPFDADPSIPGTVPGFGQFLGYPSPYPPSPPTFYTLEIDDTPQDIYIIIQTGEGLSNITLQATASPALTLFLPTNPLFAPLQGLGINTHYPCCVWDTLNQPAGMGDWWNNPP